MPLSFLLCSQRGGGRRAAARGRDGHVPAIRRAPVDLQNVAPHPETLARLPVPYTRAVSSLLTSPSASMAASSTCTRPPATVLRTDGSRRSTVDEFVACALETKPESPQHRHRLVLHRLGRRRSAADTTASAPPRPPRVFCEHRCEPRLLSPFLHSSNSHRSHLPCSSPAPLSAMA